MLRFHTVIAAALLGVVASHSEAAFTLQISIDGGTTFSTFVDDGTGSDLFAGDGVVSGAKGVSPGVVVSVTATSNQPAGVDFAQIQQVQIDTNNTSADSVAFDLVVRISDDLFTSPASGSPSTLSSSFSGTVGVGIENSAATFQSTVDYSATLFGGLPSVVTPGPTDTTGVQAFSIPELLSGTADIGGSTTALTTVSNTPFSLSNQFTITDLMIGAGGSLQLTGTTNLSAVPVPAGMMLALTGLPVLGFGYLRRRKATKAETVA